MSDSLEDLIRDLAKRGEISHLSLAPRMIERGDKKINGWGATFAPASVFGNTFGEDTDPVNALKNALNDAKLRRKSEFKDGQKRPPVRRTAATDQDLSDILG